MFFRSVKLLDRVNESASTYVMRIKIGSYAVISLDTYVSYPSAIKSCASLVLIRSHLPISNYCPINGSYHFRELYYGFRSVLSSRAISLKIANFPQIYATDEDCRSFSIHGSLDPRVIFKHSVSRIIKRSARAMAGRRP